MSPDAIRWRRDLPLDAASREALAAQGLDLRLVDTDAERDAWMRADARGFLDPEPDQAYLDADRPTMDRRRVLGVYDAAATQPDVPIGAFATWVAELSVPGDVTVPMLAVSSVSVSPTHAARGIARAMMEAELRTAAAAGVPVAGLTASRATLYGRYGFACAADVCDWVVDTTRAGWAGRQPAARVDYVDPAQAAREAPAVHDRVRRRRPGELDVHEGAWARFAGLHPEVSQPRAIRALHATDADGVVHGVAFYTVRDSGDDLSHASAHVRHLVADTDDAHAALWRQLLRLPLITTLRAELLALDEPVRHMVADQRAITATVHDHQWLRILDVRAALQARRYDVPGRVVLQVDDPLGIDGGRWMLEVGPDGRAHVEPAAASGDAPVVAMGTAELSAVYLGGTRVRTLAQAGRVQGTGTDVDAASRLLSWHVPPRLSFWY